VVAAVFHCSVGGVKTEKEDRAEAWREERERGEDVVS
jgi:hypothetical protein